MDSLDRAGDDETGVLTVRAARAAAVIGATESAQAACFEARLVALSPSELDRVQSESWRRVASGSRRRNGPVRRTWSPRPLI
jgi:hypothetical protein